MMNTTASNDDRISSSAWGEAAAFQLLQLKHQQPSRAECHAASELLHVILQSTGDSSLLPLTPRRCSSALLSTGEGATSQNDNNVAVPFTNDTVNVSALPMPVAHSHDEQHLSPLQCYVRQHCAEFFAATASDIGTKGRQSPIWVGRIGIRCAFCNHMPRDQQAAQATSFPTKVSFIYSSVVMLQCRHFPLCKELPDSVREHLDALANLRKKKGNSASASNSAKPTRQDYWINLARDMGFIDAIENEGVCFDPSLCGIEKSSKITSECKTLKNHILPSTNDVVDEVKLIRAPGPPRTNVVSPFPPIVHSPVPINYELLIKDSELITLDDRDLVPDYVFLALAQLQPCKLGTDDRIGVYRERPIGFKGMCCRHCRGCQPGPGYGKYFPNSTRSLAQTTTTQTIVKHITTKCKHVPQDVKNAISSLQHEANEDNKPAYAPKSSSDDRPKYGSRKKFFQRIWDRLHGSDHAIAPTQPNDKPVPMSHGFSLPDNKVFRPTPIRRTSTVPASSVDVSHRFEIYEDFDMVSSGDESFCVNRDLFDDKNRRVTITGSIFSTNKSKRKRRCGAFTEVAVPREKL